MAYPRIPGHEVIGVIRALGDEVAGWKIGDRVGVGWNGGHGIDPEVIGLVLEGGYAEYMVAYANGMAQIPAGISSEEAAPLVCAGVTTFGALKNSAARFGDVVAVQGIGGLGHLAIQYAHHAGFYTMAVSRGQDKKALSLELGAHRYIDADSEDASALLKELGGARVILATASNGKAIADLFDGLGPVGEMVVVAGTGEPMPIAPTQLLNGRRRLRAWTAGQAKDSEDTIQFSIRAGVHPMIETFSLEEAPKAFERMMSSKVRFRAVLTM